MLVWLDGRTNTRQRPQENFGREIMELFTLGVGNYTEQDVYAAARVFTGWNLRLVGDARNDAERVLRVRLQRRTSTSRRRRRSLPDLSRRQHGRFRRARPATGCRTASTSSTRWRGIPKPRGGSPRKLWNFFVSERCSAGPGVRRRRAERVPAERHRACKPVVQLRPAVALVPESRPTGYARYSWPVEFVVRAIKEVGWAGFSVDSGAAPLEATWGRRCSSRPTCRLGARPGMVLDRRDAGAHELRLDAGVEPAIQPRRDAAAGPGVARGRSWSSSSTGCRRRRTTRRAATTRCSTISRPAPPGPAPTRS